MSATPESPTVECRSPDCSELGRKWEFHHGKYCSNECEHRHDGHQALAQFRYDHTRCFSCFRRLKQVEPPKPDHEFDAEGTGWAYDDEGRVTLQKYTQAVTREAACGFEYLTPAAGKGEKTHEGATAMWVVTGTICDACGATDHTDHDLTLADRRAIGRLVALFDGDDDHTVDAHTLHRVYARTRDLNLAVGRALTDND